MSSPEEQIDRRSQGAADSAKDLAIELRGICKSFGPVQANKDIDLAVRAGTIHGIVGENGAGKSTLMSILYGFYTADSGETLVNGKNTVISDSRHALELGIGMVHQHFMLVDNFTVLENVILGAEGDRLLGNAMQKARNELERLASDYGLEVDPDAIVEELSVGRQQRVEILKALYRGADILVLDEPTGVLTPGEADHLFRILEQLRAQGKTIILITHKLREIMAITDEVSVMRRGEIVTTLETGATNPNELAELMVGRQVLLRVEKSEAEPKGEVLRVQNLRVADDMGVERVKDISFDVKAGEIIGIAGVAGNGQSELLEAISGMRAPKTGKIFLNDREISFHGDASAGPVRDNGLAHVPEDRQRMGLVTAFAEWENSMLGYEDKPIYGAGAGLDINACKNQARDRIEKFDIRPQDCNLKTANFSGGNQQKIVLAREMDRDLDILVVGQPTRGVDIGAIEFIHNQIIAMRDAGKAILLVSVELDEIRSLADRILVMFDGQIIAETTAQESDEGQLGLFMAGVNSSQQEQSA